MADSTADNKAENVADAVTDVLPDSTPVTKQEKSHSTPAPLQSISNSSTGPRSPPPNLRMSSPSPGPHSAGHRSSFAENMRGIPVSPRASRQPSLTQQALQDLLNNPPTKPGDPRFAGRDWKSIKIGEIVDESQVRFVENDTSVEEATNVSHISVRVGSCISVSLEAVC